MLVFTRRRDEAIIIGDGIEVRVLRVGRDGVRLGISAPGHVPVHRREVYDQIRAANAQAATDASAVHAVLARLRRGRAGDSGVAAAVGAPAHDRRIAGGVGREAAGDQ